MRARTLPAIAMATVACAGCQTTYMEAEPLSGAEAVAAATEYLGGLGEGSCGAAGWAAVFVTTSDGRVGTTIRCGPDIDVDALLGLPPEALHDSAAGGSARRKARVAIAGAKDDDLDAAGRQALQRALELVQGCADGETGSWAETNVDDYGRTTEIRIECDPP